MCRPDPIDTRGRLMSLLRTISLLLIITVLLLAGCATHDGVRPLPRAVIDRNIPTIAILDFENKAYFPYRWNLGQGIRDRLVDELVNSRRYTVLNRADIQDVINELEMQNSPKFRKEGRLDKGRLKNVKYLIKGAVTDFSHVAGGGVRAFVEKFGIGSGGEMAVVSVTLYVTDVETGEVVVSRSFSGNAWAGKTDIVATYKNVSFGARSFYRTPLGEATTDVIRKCIKSISQAIVREKWYPSVVKVVGDTLIFSGGIDRGIEVGSIWTAYEAGEILIDPQTGDELGRLPGKDMGRVEVVEVEGRFSHATIFEGEFAPGQTLKMVPEEKPDETRQKIRR
jgi:curli biogenesis system outer membrane secretion channel CsgG